jgi:hypothetical protein
MGTIARLNAQQTDAFFTALHDLPAPLAACASFKVMWKLRAEAQSHLRALLQSGRLLADSVTELPNEGVMIKHGHVEIRVSKWIPSQLALFQLNTLRLFVSHCGINSAHEALFFGIPLICIPLFAGMASRYDFTTIPVWLFICSIVLSQIKVTWLCVLSIPALV